MLEFVLSIVIIVSAILALILLAPDVALTQAIVEGAIIPIFIALAVKKTQRSDD